ncbi:MAG: polyphosphate kinase 1 [Fimbriimonadaceae bacterium]|jgi:polyphosphate kinase|nr:polyphosphate kinase 1 [Fimbriimonadaceae bacterium]
MAVRDSQAKTSPYFNREYSWLQFNRRVLSEAQNEDNPLLERIKFLAIFESNLDEFYMVRVSGLIEQDATGLAEISPDGLTSSQQLEMIAMAARLLRQDASTVWQDQLKPALAGEGIHIREAETLTAKQQENLYTYFRRAIFPLCTPLMLEPCITFPFISNRSLNLAVVLKDGASQKLARVKIPPVIPRLIPVPGRSKEFVLAEDLISNFIGSLFPGVDVLATCPFRVIRDADIEIRQLEAADLISAVEQSLRLRRFGDPVLLEIAKGLESRWIKVLQNGLSLDDSDVIEVDGTLGMEFMWELAKVDKPQLKFPPHIPYVAESLSQGENLFNLVRDQDLLVHHPYDSFFSVEQFIRSAQSDPNVIGVKQTLYRVGSESPIVESLLGAAEEGKQVAAMVELKARFDENNNLVWSRALERAGVHVTYGVLDMKVHCKLSLVVRKDRDGIRSYVHVGTGNYNPSTARLYTDLGLFTSDPEIVEDVTELFNVLTGYSKQSQFRKLLVAPFSLREGIIERIERETQIARETGKGSILFKLNSLVDPEIIDALYEASQAGVEIKLVVRGICCLRPGVSGLSENIEVVSIVGRFLEHCRVYYFENSGDPDVFIGSADMMRRNLDRRIEVLVPVTRPEQIKYLREVVVLPSFEDNAKAWDLLPNGTYERRPRLEGMAKVSVQDLHMTMPATKLLLSRRTKRRSGFSAV